MTSKLNIFNSLPQHASDSEEETNSKNAKTKLRHDKQETRKHDNEKGHSKHTAPRDPNQKEDVARAKNQHKQKGVTAEPHPNDRHSGTGQSAYGGKPKRGGAGKGNVGNYKEDRKAGEEGEEVEETEEVVEEKPEGRTLAEYFAERRGPSGQTQVNEAKSKITSEQLMKEVGKATLLKTKNQQEIDDKKVGKKKGNLDVDHHAGLNSEHAELLNFRTGFVEKEYKERVRGEEGQQPRRFGGNREKAPRENKEEAQPEGEAQPKAEGEAAPAEGQTAEATKPEGTKPEGQQDNRRRNEGQRGGRGGYQKGGERRPYQGNKPSTKQVNVEDESAFPKLG